MTRHPRTPISLRSVKMHAIDRKFRMIRSFMVVAPDAPIDTQVKAIGHV
jgi:hypothetical protein